MQSNDVIEVVTPVGAGISEVTLFPDATAVLAGTAGRFERQTVQTTSAIVMRQMGMSFPLLPLPASVAAKSIRLAIWPVGSV
jgi:hypothetical protein